MQFGKGILPAKEYLSNGLFSIQNCYSEAESSFNQQLHFHDFYELSLIYEGSSRFLINGSSFVAAAGSLQLIRPSDYHRQMTDTGEYIRYYNLIFRQEVLSNVLLDALEVAVEPFCFQMQEKEMQKMTQLLLELKREQEEKEAFWEKMSADLIEKICILILRKSPKKRQAKEEEIPEAVRRSLVFVRQHYREKIRLSDAAQKAGLSESYFSSVFHACMGVTFSEYMLNYRLSLAKRMLEEGNISSKEVCAACGFFSYSYFLTTFRQKYDISPGALTRSCQNAIQKTYK